MDDVAFSSCVVEVVTRRGLHERERERALVDERQRAGETSTLEPVSVSMERELTVMLLQCETKGGEKDRITISLPEQLEDLRCLQNDRSLANVARIARTLCSVPVLLSRVV